MWKQRALDPRFLTVALTLAALGCEPGPDFVTRHGVEFHLQGTGACSREQAEKMEAAFLERLDETSALPGARRVECLDQARVVFEPGFFPCTGDSTRTCAGEQFGGTLRVAALECPFESAYIHELLHWLQECVDGRVDYGHEEPTWRVVWEQLDAAREWCNPAVTASARFPAPDLVALHEPAGERQPTRRSALVIRSGCGATNDVRPTRGTPPSSTAPARPISPCQ